MNEASLALCGGLLALKASRFVRRHRSLRSALASAKHNVQQELASEGGAAEAGNHILARAAQPPAAAEAAAPTRGVAAQERTPVVARTHTPEVSPLIQRGETWGPSGDVTHVQLGLHGCSGGAS
jgi:predicted lipid-binding transport protein (Tim44 family)